MCRAMCTKARASHQFGLVVVLLAALAGKGAVSALAQVVDGQLLGLHCPPHVPLPAQRLQLGLLQPSCKGLAPHPPHTLCHG